MCVRWGWIQSATSSTQTGCYLLSDRRRSEANCHSLSRGEMQRCDKSLKNDYHSQHHLSQVLLFWTWVEMNSFECIIIQFTCLKKASGWFQALITLLCDLMVCVCVCAREREISGRSTVWWVLRWQPPQLKLVCCHAASIYPECWRTATILQPQWASIPSSL